MYVVNAHSVKLKCELCIRSMDFTMTECNEVFVGDQLRERGFIFRSEILFYCT